MVPSQRILGLRYSDSSEMSPLLFLYLLLLQKDLDLIPGSESKVKQKQLSQRSTERCQLLQDKPEWNLAEVPRLTSWSPELLRGSPSSRACPGHSHAAPGPFAFSPIHYYKLAA